MERKGTVRIAVASRGLPLDSELEPQFDRAEYFVVFDTDSGQFDVVDNRGKTGTQQDVEVRGALDLVYLGVDAVITTNVAPRPASVLQAGNVEVYADAWGNVTDAFEEYLLRPLS
jgi:predicted Fe-Mo cluster-binding NifX family protein